MNTPTKKLTQVISVLLLGTASVTLYAAPNQGTPPPPPVASTAFVYGGANQASVRCNAYNPSEASLTVTEVHAEDGQGNVLTPIDDGICANAVLTGKRACTASFTITAEAPGAVCLATPTPPEAKPAKGTPPPAHPVLSMEILDSDGNLLVHANGLMPPPPPQGPKK